MTEYSLTLTIVVFTAIIVFVVAKVAPALRNEDPQCPPCPPCPPSPEPWRFLGGTISIKRKQEIEENYQGFMPPEGK